MMIFELRALIRHRRKIFCYTAFSLAANIMVLNRAYSFDKVVLSFCSEHKSQWCLGHLLSNPVCPSRSDDSHSITPLKSLVVAVIAANRPQYFEQLARSLISQYQLITDSRDGSSKATFALTVYVDFIDGDIDREFVLEIAQGLEIGANATIVKPLVNQGVAKLTWLAQMDAFSGESVHDGLILLEEDHLIGRNYLQGMLLLLEASEAFPEVGMVNGNFKDTPSDGAIIGKYTFARDVGCHFQMTEYDSIREIHSHNVWGWGVTRNKWERMQEIFREGYTAANLAHVPYRERDSSLIKEIIRRMCPGTGYDNWGGQDWLRACAFHASGMTLKLQPTHRMMSYIGSRGMHTKQNHYDGGNFDPVPAEALSASIEDWHELLCDGMCRLHPPKLYLWASRKSYFPY